MRHQASDLKQALAADRFLAPGGFGDRAVVLIKNRGGDRPAVRVERNKSLAMRTEANCLYGINYVFCDCLAGGANCVPEFLRIHFRHRRVRKIRSVRRGVLSQNLPADREAHGLACAGSNVDGKQAHDNRVTPSPLPTIAKSNYRKLPTRALSSRSPGAASTTCATPPRMETSFTPENASGVLNNMIRKRTARRDFAGSQR